MVDLNDLAVKISEVEGLKKQVDIAQIKEVLKHTLIELGKYPSTDVDELLRRYR